MNKKKESSFFNFIYFIMAILVIGGSILKFYEFSIGGGFALIGIVIGASVLITENVRLKRRIRENEK
jgi:hypothetical protein